LSLTTWWEGLPEPITLTQLNQVIRKAEGQGFYRSDRGACAEPAAGDLAVLFEVMRGLEGRIEQGSRYVEEHPTVATAVRKLSLLSRDYEATWPTFERALTAYEAEQKG